MSFAPPPRKNQIVSIVTLMVMLIGVIIMGRRCGHGVDAMFKALEGPASLRDRGGSDGR